MIMQFAPGIRRSSGHIYTSALPFSPPCRLKQQYDSVSHSNYLTHGVPTSWDPNYCTIDLPDIVQSVSYSSDGSRIAARTQSGIHIFNSLTGAEIKSLEAPKDLSSVVFSPDGSRMVVAAAEEATVWDVATGTPLVNLTGHTRLIQSVAFASDGTKFITGSCDDTLRVWNSYNGLLISSRFRGGVRCEKWGYEQEPAGNCITHFVTLSPDTINFARGIPYGVEIWDWHNNYPLRRLRDFSSDPCLKVRFLHGNVQLITQPRCNNTLKIWNYQTGTSLKSINIDGEIFVSPFGPQLAQQCLTSGELLIWSTETWTEIKVLTRGKAHPRSTFPLAFSPDGRRLAFSPGKNCLQVWEFTGGSLTPGSTDHLLDNEIAPGSLAVSADGSVIACCICIPTDIRTWSDVRTIFKVWDKVNGSSPKLSTCKGEELQLLTCSPDGRLLASYRAVSGKLIRISVRISSI